MAAAHSDPLPSAEKARFDRSERLWGAEAQALLRTGTMCLLGASAPGCEVLKNAVLPGLGNFIVVDDAKVTKQDLGCNFFLEPKADLGKNIAEAVVPILSELNPLSKGEAVAQSTTSVVKQGLGWFKDRKVNIVVASSRVSLDDLLELGKTLDGQGIPVVVVKACGQIGQIRIQADPRYIVHTMTDVTTQVVDMRALNPFPALEAWFEDHNPDNKAALDERDKTLYEDSVDVGKSFAHLPWPCIMWHALRKWRAAKEGRTATTAPANAADWKEVKEVIGQWAVPSREGGAKKLMDSFIDAQQNCAMRMDLSKRNKPELAALLKDERAVKPGKDDHNFWFLVHGLKLFKEKHGVMPLAPTIPDFTATTEMFQALKKIFETKAKEDADEILGHARAALGAAGLPADTVSAEEAAQFSAQAWELRHVTYPSLADEFPATGNVTKLSPVNLDNFTSGHQDMNMTTYQMEPTPAMKWYIVSRAAASFKRQHGRVPGEVASAADVAKDTSDDVAQLTALVAEIAPDLVADMGDFVKEWVRFGGGETVTIASIIGAVGSQECIKLIQNRRVPASFCLLFDGIGNFFTTISA